MTPDKNIIILAPHVDDEMIGCWRYLTARQVSHVFYFSEITPIRRKELHKVAEVFGFIGETFHSTTIPKKMRDRIVAACSTNTVILAPNCRDEHPYHKWVNNEIAKKIQFNLKDKVRVQYYSVDMNVSKDVLPPATAEKKKADLIHYYPSQASLFQDAKYYLFESDLSDDRTTSIEVSFQFEGIHCYPEAPAGVEFLQHPHRHMFHVNVELQVWHDDRDVEFILLKRELQAFVKDGNMNHKSCEMIAKDIMDYVVAQYSDRSCKVRVSEDGENAATVTYNLWS